MSKFQLIALFIFIVAIIAGVIAFATYKGGGNNKTDLPAITVWGTFPSQVFERYVAELNSERSSSLKITYVEKRPGEFSASFVNALALGQGPDAILVSTDMLLPEANKLAIIPYSVLSKNTFFNSYIDEARIYLNDNGVLAVPFSVDPLVMYWNRDIFNSAGIASYPLYWDEFTGTTLKPGLVQKITSKDSNGNIRKSAVAMGDITNITNGREILGSLLLQIGNPVTIVGNDGLVVSAINPYYKVNPVPAFQFFGQFANPSDANYSWNRGLPNDKLSFLSGNLATYFGYASELSDIRNKNVNLNFDVASLPQLRSGGQKAVYAKMYGFSLVKASRNLDGAFAVISELTRAENINKLSLSMYAPSIRRDIIGLGSNDPYITIFNQSALVAKSWLDAGSDQSRYIFNNIVQSVSSGSKNIDQAVKDAGDQYDVILRRVQ